MKCSQKQLIFCAGLFWVLVGLVLIARGIILLQGNLEGLYLLGVAAAIILGFLKAVFVLRKVVGKTAHRIRGLATPVPFYRMYSGRSWLFVLFMMGLGISLMIFKISPVLRGDIIIGVGVALCTGSIGYWQELRKADSKSGQKGYEPRPC